MAKKRSAKTKYTKSKAKAPKVRIGKSKNGVSLSRPKKEIKCIGVYRANTKGFGFVTVEGIDDDIHINEKYTNGALDGDTVEVAIRRPADKNHRAEGDILRILAHGRETFVGTYEKSKSFGFVIVDDAKIPGDIFVKYENSMKAVDGSKVVVKIIDYGNDRKSPEGEIIEILGHIDDPGVDIICIARSFGIYEQFPIEAMEQAKSLPDKVKTKDRQNRKDYRKKLTVTIDGADTKDVDDAITLEKTKKGYKLIVHIADVSHYVTEGSPLDVEALNRGNSSYLVDTVIPMLPHSLSNGICSLNEGVDRLTLSCVMKFDNEGNQISHEIVEGVIKSNHKMTYDEVQEIIDNPDGEMATKYEDVKEMLLYASELSDLLRNKRLNRGFIEFDFPECKIKLDEQGKPTDVSVYERHKSHMLIEDFMLAANETVAQEFSEREIPFLYRVHEKPEEAKMETLAGMLRGFGIKFPKTEDIKPIDIQRILNKAAGTPDENFVKTAVLRSMQRAKYSPECLGHFGLADKYYTHFTSPIRRYPDLQIHRIIKEVLHGTMTKKYETHFANILPGVAEKTSTTERRSDDAERECEKLKKVEYMEDKLGEEFVGNISGVTSWGIYVALPNTIEGLVAAQTMRDDYYIYNEQKMTMTGERTGKVYRLGDEVKVKLVRTDKLAKTLDFVLVKENGSEQRAHKAHRKQ